MVDLETILWVLWQFKFNVKKEAKKQQKKNPNYLKCENQMPLSEFKHLPFKLLSNWLIFVVWTELNI